MVRPPNARVIIPVSQDRTPAVPGAAEAIMNVSALESERSRLTRFWHYFKRRALEHRITDAQNVAAGANFTLTDARAAAEAVEKEPLPEFPGLLVETRRAINVAWPNKCRP